MCLVYIAECFKSSVYKPLDLCPVRSYLPSTDLAIAKLKNCPEYRIAPSTIRDAGRGLFAQRLFSARSTICNYFGYILTNREFEWIVANGFFINTGVNLSKCGFKTKVPCSMVGVPGYPGSVINHKPSPHNNCRFVLYQQKQTKTGFMDGWLVVEVLREKTVQAGEEFFADYGPEANHINLTY